MTELNRVRDDVPESDGLGVTDLDIIRDKVLESDGLEGVTESGNVRRDDLELSGF